uniref:Uncharacterized protein n=1 Tax=Spongospora subterranea TaxID=70186 RepID=A0A0H5QZR9_9EUKA|eukprot:CRZ07189.1 hypothetical protein [Spongospora subterranea]
MIEFERQLTETERLHMLMFLLSLRGVTVNPFPDITQIAYAMFQIRQSLQRHFRSFSNSKDGGHRPSSAFRPDPDAINTLVRFGHQFADDGGVFAYEVDDSLRLNKIFLQKPEL